MSASITKLAAFARGQKVDDSHEQKLIRTMRGMGYVVGEAETD